MTDTQPNTNASDLAPPPPAPGNSVEIDVNLKEQPQEKITLNFGKDANMNDFISRPTETETKRISGDGPVTESTKQVVTNSLSQFEDPSRYTQEVTEEEFKDVAEGLIWIIDLILTWVLAKFSLDPNTSTTPYKVQEDKMKRMTRVFAKVLMQMKAKFPLGWLCFALIIACYFPAFMKARDARAEVLKKREAEKNKILGEQKTQTHLSNLQKKIRKTNSENVSFKEVKKVEIPKMEDIEDKVEFATIIPDEEPKVKAIVIDRNQFTKRASEANTTKREKSSSDRVVPKVPSRRGGQRKN